jgi:hypothetical protein
MAYYGFEHRYGANMRDQDGDLIGTLYIFKSRAARDAWIDGGNQYQNDRGTRTPVKSKYAARFQRVSGNIERVKG